MNRVERWNGGGMVEERWWNGDGMVTELYVERQQNELGNGEEGQRNGNKGWVNKTLEGVTPVRLLTFHRWMVYSPYKKGGKANASILYEMPHQEGDEGCQSYNHEERQAGDSGGMSHVWHQDVQNRKKLRLILKLNQTGSRDSFSVLFFSFNHT